MDNPNQPSAPSPPRHWRGDPGNRHEHYNVWVQGGPKKPYKGPMIPGLPASPGPFTATPAVTGVASPSEVMDRRSSNTSTMSSSSTSSSNGNNNNNNNGMADRNSPPVAPQRRRSSGHGPSTLFESLTSQKRSPEDAGLAARRASWNEQAEKGGFFSAWWHGYTRGSGK